jgi:hypothetical protein
LLGRRSKNDLFSKYDWQNYRNEKLDTALLKRIEALGTKKMGMKIGQTMKSPVLDIIRKQQGISLIEN